ncbi:MAG: glycosyltransferase [Peptococcaceae bacterium]|nr:glycosyltransferase [Peptococcaceae bacterium]
MPKVSVIMPSLNVASYMRECIESVINQTLKDIEIICVDAGSTDGTLEILKEYKNKDSRIKIIISDRKSYGYQMNLGIDIAKGKYITIVETDDLIAYNMLEDLYTLCESYKLDLIKTDFYRFTVNKKGEKELIYHKRSNDPSFYNRVLCPSESKDTFYFLMNTWAALYNLEFIRKNNIRHNETPGASFQDNGFWFQTLALADRVYFLNKAYYMNRRDNPNSSVKSASKIYCMKDEYDFIFKFLHSKKELWDKFGDIYYRKKYDNYIWNLSRIADEYKLEFILHFRNEFYDAVNDVLFNNAKFSEEALKTIKDIIYNPIAYYYNNYHKQKQISSSYSYQMNKQNFNKSKKKILLYNWISFDNPEGVGGGVTVYIKNLINEINKSEPDIEVYFLSSGWAYDKNSIDIYLRELSVSQYRCRNFEIVNSPAFAPGGWIAQNPSPIFDSNRTVKPIFKKFMDDYGPFDVVHFNNIEGLTIDVLSLKNDFPRTKFILSVHNYALICPLINLYQHHNHKVCTDYGNGSECINCIRHSNRIILKELSGRIEDNPKDSWLSQTGLKLYCDYASSEDYIKYRKLMISSINKYIDDVLAVSKRVAEIIASYGINKNKVYVSYIGSKIAEKQIMKIKASITYNLKIAFIGYANKEEKGFNFLVDALSKLSKEDAKRIDFLVAAKNCNENDIRHVLKDLHSVTIKDGYVLDELPILLKDVNLGIVPVLWEDNLPQVAIEMVSCGVPVLCSSYGGASELCDSELFRFDGGNTQDLLNHITHFLHYPMDLNKYWDYHNSLKTMSDHIGELKRYYGLDEVNVSNPIVSVIIPVYNVEKYLPQCLDSLLNQTLKDIEIICIDDGSTDNSLSILRRYEEMDSRVRVYTQNNKGAGAARNKGIELARGEYFSFLDSDDFFEPEMLELAYKASVDNNADIVQFFSDSYNDKNSKFEYIPNILKINNFPCKNPFSVHDIPEKIFNLGNKWAWDKLYKASFVKENNIMFQEIRTSNDMYFVCVSLVLANKIFILPNILAHQRINRSDSLSVTREKSYDCYYIALLKLKKKLVELNMYDTVKRSFVNWAIDFCLWNLNSISGLPHLKIYEQLYYYGFREFDIDDQPSYYFYNDTHFAQYLKIRATNPIDYTENYIRRNILKNQNDIELVKKNVEAVVEPCVFCKCRRFILYFFRKTLGFFKCIQDHGLIYTLRYAKRKASTKLKNIRNSTYRA